MRNEKMSSSVQRTTGCVLLSIAIGLIPLLTVIWFQALSGDPFGLFLAMLCVVVVSPIAVVLNALPLLKKQTFKFYAIHLAVAILNLVLLVLLLTSQLIGLSQNGDGLRRTEQGDGGALTTLIWQGDGTIMEKS